MTSRKYIAVLLKPVDIFLMNCWSKGCNWSLPLVLRGRGVPLVQALRGVPSRRIYINIMRLRKHNYVLFTQFLPENKNYAMKIIQKINEHYFEQQYIILIYHYDIIVTFVTKYMPQKNKSEIMIIWKKQRSRLILPQVLVNHSIPLNQGRPFHPKQCKRMLGLLISFIQGLL